jgi:hypothetical protein
MIQTNQDSLYTLHQADHFQANQQKSFLHMIQANQDSLYTLHQADHFQSNQPESFLHMIQTNLFILYIRVRILKGIPFLTGT